MEFSKSALLHDLAGFDEVAEIDTHDNCDDVLVLTIPTADYDDGLLAEIETVARVCWYQIQTVSNGGEDTRIELFPEDMQEFRMNRSY